MYLNLGLRLEDGSEKVEGAAEPLGGELEETRSRILASVRLHKLEGYPTVLNQIMVSGVV